MFDQSKMAAEEASSSCSWSREEDEAFENAVADYPDDAPDRFEKIAAAVPGKTAEDIRKHYEVLVEDVMAIEAGRVPLPNYTSTSEGSADHGGNSRRGGGDSAHSGRASRADQERRKGIAWTEEEHRLFLLGLDKYGKGDWRSISRNFVISRTPTQVASHAQKYFIRLNSMNKDRRRTSIHDITTVGSGGDVTAPQGPITGQANGPAPAKPAKNSAHPVVGVYGTTIGQPVGGPHLTAVGTPVGSHMAYGVRAPGTMVPGAPVNLAPMTYPMPRTSSSAQR